MKEIKVSLEKTIINTTILEFKKRYFFIEMYFANLFFFLKFIPKIEKKYALGLMSSGQ